MRTKRRVKLTAEQVEAQLAELRRSGRSKDPDDLPDIARWAPVGLGGEGEEALPYTGPGVTLDSLRGRAMLPPEEYWIPGVEAPIWIHPFSLGLRAKWLKQTANIAGTIKVSDNPSARELQQQALGMEFAALQACLVCRQGPEREAMPCFPEKHYRLVADELGEERIGEIVGRALELANPKQQEEEPENPFVQVSETLSAWLSAYGDLEDCPPGLKAMTLESMQLLQATGPPGT
jgi:hypothetical protein